VLDVREKKEASEGDESVGGPSESQTVQRGREQIVAED